MLTVEIAVAKVPRHGETESGDTVEVIERPGGGFSVVLVDGQGSGRGAKTLSNMIVTRAISQVKDGARDGVVARAAHDYLYTYRAGQALATLNLLSVDLRSGTILMTRNNPAPFFVIAGSVVQRFGEPSQSIGLQPHTRPQITEIALTAYTYVIVFTDGLLKAGAAVDDEIDVYAQLEHERHNGLGSATDLAERLLAHAVARDDGQPTDDISIVVLAVLPREETLRTRRMQVGFPIDQPVVRRTPHAGDM